MKPTNEQVLSWAREAGVDWHQAHEMLVLRHSNGSWIGVDDVVQIIATLAYAAGAAAMKERAAKVCESLFDAEDHSCDEAEQCAAAIRALGDDE